MRQKGNGMKIVTNNAKCTGGELVIEYRLKNPMSGFTASEPAGNRTQYQIAAGRLVAIKIVKESNGFYAIFGAHLTDKRFVTRRAGYTELQSLIELYTVHQTHDLVSIETGDQESGLLVLLSCKNCDFYDTE